MISVFSRWWKAGPEQSQCVQAVSEIPTTQVRDSPDQPLQIFPAQNDRGEVNIGVRQSVFPLVQALCGNQGTAFRDSSMLCRTQLMGRVLSAESIRGEAPFPKSQRITGQRTSLQRDAVLSVLAFCTTWTAQSCVQGPDSQTRELQWGTFESSDFWNHLKFSSFTSWVSTCTQAHVSSCLHSTWVWKSPKPVSKTHKNHNMSPKIHMLNKFTCWLNEKYKSFHLSKRLMDLDKSFDEPIVASYL